MMLRDELTKQMIGRELERLRNENTQLRAALEANQKFVDLAIACAEEIPSELLTRAINIGQDNIKALAATKPE